jgi:hypothetical protein
MFPENGPDGKWKLPFVSANGKRKREFSLFASDGIENGSLFSLAGK